MSDAIPATGRIDHRRLRELGSHDRELIHAILDEGLVCHVGLAAPHGPLVIPMGYGRDGERLLLHGSVGSRLMRALAAGAEACLTVTLLDGLVLARSLFHSSMNYRSVVIFGRGRGLEGRAEKEEALAAISEHLAPGRAREARGPSPEELAKTAVVEFPVDEASAKVRSGPPHDEEEDLSLPIWAGVVPFRMAVGEPVPAPDLGAAIPAPAHVRGYRRR